MTVALQSPIVRYIGNGISTIYTYPFYLLEFSHLQVYKNDVLQTPDTYTVNSIGNPNGGEVVFSVAPLVGEVIILRRVVPATQLVDYQPFDAFPADTHERALDKLTMLVQDGFLTDTNSVRAPTLEPAGLTNLILPAIPQRANFLLGFDPNGNVVMYPQQTPLPAVTDHGSLTGLSDNDHPQYLMVADAFGTYLPKSGGTMTGVLTLMTGFPGGPFDAVPKSYVDTFIGTVITKSILSNAIGDAEATVHQAWNAQATTGGITRASNEIIYYRWPSTGQIVYRYTGQQQGPINWTTTASDWVSAAGVEEAPLDARVYGRTNASWVEVLPKTGGVFTGPIESNGFTTHGDIQINGDGVVTGSWSANTLAVTGDTTIGGTLNCGPIISPSIGVTGPMLFADGTAVAPGIAWLNAPGSGWYRSTDSTGTYSINGAAIFGIAPAALNSNVGLNLFAGTGLAVHAGGAQIHAGGMVVWSGGLAVQVGAGRFPDGTFALPGISWVTDPDTGWVHSPDGTGTYTINTTPVFGIAPTQITSNVSMTVYGHITVNSGNVSAARFIAGDVLGFSWANSLDSGFSRIGTNTFRSQAGGAIVWDWNTINFTLGPGVNLNVPGASYLTTVNVAGGLTAGSITSGTITTNSIPSYISTLGYFRFDNLSPSNCFVQFQGGTDGTAAGAEMAFYTPSARAIFRINCVGENFGVGAEVASVGIGIARGGAAVANDFTLSRNNISLPKFTVRGGYDGAITNYLNCPLMVDGVGGGSVGIGLHYAGIVGWAMRTVNTDIRFGSHFQGGPVGIGYSSMQIGPDGGIFARSYNTTTLLVRDASARPITGALLDVLKLHGVRCINDETGKPDIGILIDELEEAFPEMVSEATPGDRLSRGFNSALLAAPIIEAIRELHNRVTALEAA